MKEFRYEIPKDIVEKLGKVELDRVMQEAVRDMERSRADMWKCSTCRWRKRVVGVAGYFECRGNPPSIMGLNGAQWPVVAQLDWCRLWEQRPKSAVEDG